MSYWFENPECTFFDKEKLFYYLIKQYIFILTHKSGPI